MRLIIVFMIALCISAVTGWAKCLTPLPVQTSKAQKFLLEAEPESKEASTVAPNITVLHSKITHYDADNCTVEGDQILCVNKAGYAASSVTLRYSLDKPVSGLFDFWSCFALGGLSTQEFVIRAGVDPLHLDTRSSFSQSNDVSWQMTWRKGDDRVALYPWDKYLEVTITGVAVQQKNLDAFLLVKHEPIQRGITPDGAHWRSLVTERKTSPVNRRLYILETGNAADSDLFFRCLAGTEVSNIRKNTESTIFTGAEAKQIADATGVNRLPAIVVMDESYVVRGVLNSPSTERDVFAFIHKACGDGSAPGPFPVKIASKKYPIEPLRDGSPISWLTQGVWGGVGGLSLWGLGTESHVRPNPGDPCYTIYFDTFKLTHWSINQADKNGHVVLSSESDDYSWSRGTSYGHVYMHADRDIIGILHLAQTGIRTFVWLDGLPVKLDKDLSPPANCIDLSLVSNTSSNTVTDQGNKINVQTLSSESPMKYHLMLMKGWHRLLVKHVMQNRINEDIKFAVKFTDLSGKALTGLKTSLNDPTADLALHTNAAAIMPLVYIDAPTNLVYPGQPLKLRIDCKTDPRYCEGSIKMPIVPFDAVMSVDISDYDGRIISRRKKQIRFPTTTIFDFGNAPDAGYYSVNITLHTKQGKLAAVYPPDGFSIIRGTASQEERKDRKKISATYYFDPSPHFTWMQRMGIYRNIGSHNVFDKKMWDVARDSGLILTTDFWDYWSADSKEQKDATARNTGSYTRWFKSMNEIDIQGSNKPSPERWVERTRWEYEAAKNVRPDAFYIGGSLVRTSVDNWFTDCLKLGLDKWQDAWDVHAYPQNPPILEGTLANGPDEAELGVLECYRRLGMANDKPFWMGETGARASHGYDARRWQADTSAKIAACILSRPDFQYVGFLLPWEYSRKYGMINDIDGGHNPVEAAYYTASALIDGFPYKRLELGKDIQAARFGETIMLWSTGGRLQIAVPLLDSKDWFIVDVVGRVQPLTIGSDNSAKLVLTESPVYLIPKAVYYDLTSYSLIN